MTSMFGSPRGHYENSAEGGGSLRNLAKRIFGGAVKTEQERVTLINEYLKSDLPKVEQYADEGNFAKAVEEFHSEMRYLRDNLESEADEMSDAELDQLESDFYGTYMVGKLESSILSDDSEPLHQFIERMNVKQIPPEYTRQYMGLLKTHFLVSENQSVLSMIADIESQTYEYEAQIQENRDRAREIAEEDSEWV